MLSGGAGRSKRGGIEGEGRLLWYAARYGLVEVTSRAVGLGPKHGLVRTRGGQIAANEAVRIALGHHEVPLLSGRDGLSLQRLLEVVDLAGWRSG